MVSAVQLASNALLLLGHEPISSFTESTAGAQIASNLYETTYQSLLTQHRWRFASKQAIAARLAATPINEFSYQFQKPSDCLYLIRTSTENYEVFEDKIYANVSELNIEYLYRVQEDKLPPYFAKMFEFMLAAQFAIPLTGSIEKAQFYTGIYKDQLRIAKFTDSTQRPQDTFIDSPYTDVRN